MWVAMADIPGSTPTRPGNWTLVASTSVSSLSRSGRQPYDVDRSLARGEYRIGSDRELSGLTFDNVPEGAYRIGLFHSSRGWYWTAPILSIDSSGTVKYGLRPEYAPGFRLFPSLAHGFSIYDAMVLMAMLFAAVGMLLASRQIIVVAREGELVRREAIALVTGGPMPQAQTKKAARALRRRAFATSHCTPSSRRRARACRSSARNRSS